MRMIKPISIPQDLPFSRLTGGYIFPLRVFIGLSLILILSGLIYSPLVQAQSGALPSYNHGPIAQGKVLTSAMVRAELERRIARNPGNEASLWNTGYDFFRNYPHNQTTAQAIKNGFLSVRNGTAEQKLTMRKAAIYWEKIQTAGITNVPVGQNFQNRQKLYYGSRDKFTTLAKRPAGSSHQSFTDYNWPGRNISKRQPYRGRGDNPPPGKYYPGMYPP